MINSLNVAYRDFPVRQRGISLIVVLMLLVVVSLLGIASMQIVMMGSVLHAAIEICSLLGREQKRPW